MENQPEESDENFLKLNFIDEEVQNKEESKLKMIERSNTIESQSNQSINNLSQVSIPIKNN